MFNNSEELICKVCNKGFIGRKPAEGGDIFCPECLFTDELPVVNEGDKIPVAVHDEMLGGSCENEQ